MTSQDLIERLIFWILLVISLTVHEWAHAWSAWKLGDDTAAVQGRLTLNPIVHMDLVGTVLLPLLGVPFGWAVPVPINPANFNRRISPQAGMMLTAMAGPVSNLVLALGSLTVLAAIEKFFTLTPVAGATVVQVFGTLSTLNVILAVFNMLPVPPLDGSRVADYLMPPALEPLWLRFSNLGPLPLMVLLLAPQFFHVNLLGPMVTWIEMHLMLMVSWVL